VLNGRVIEFAHQKRVYEARGFPGVSAFANGAALLTDLTNPAVVQFEPLRFRNSGGA